MLPTVPANGTNVFSGAPAAGAGQMNPMALMSMLAALQAPEQQRTPLPQTTFPDQPRAMNPMFTQLVMQALLAGSQGGAPANLGQILSGMGA